MLCTTPSETFRLICRSNHGLVGSVYINWMQRWSDKVLNKVANTFLAEHPSIPETYQDAIIGHVVHVHRSIHDYSLDYWRNCHRMNYITPKHYIEFIHHYLKLIGIVCNPCRFTSFRSHFSFKFSISDENKRLIIEQCNQHAEAVAKIDEVSEQFDYLSILSTDQQNDVKTLNDKCVELAQNIEICEFTHENSD